MLHPVDTADLGCMESTRGTPQEYMGLTAALPWGTAMTKPAARLRSRQVIRTYVHVLFYDTDYKWLGRSQGFSLSLPPPNLVSFFDYRLMIPSCVLSGRESSLERTSHCYFILQLSLDIRRWGVWVVFYFFLFFIYLFFWLHKGD